MSWEDKVSRVIGKLSNQAYRQVNYDKQGRKKFKKDRPYHIPDEANQIVKCLGDKDRERGERTCKEIMEGLRRSGAQIDGAQRKRSC